MKRFFAASAMSVIAGTSSARDFELFDYKGLVNEHEYHLPNPDYKGGYDPKAPPGYAAKFVYEGGAEPVVILTPCEDFRAQGVKNITEGFKAYAQQYLPLQDPMIVLIDIELGVERAYKDCSLSM